MFAAATHEPARALPPSSSPGRSAGQLGGVRGGQDVRERARRRAGASMLDSDIAVLGPPERLELLPKRNNAGQRFRIVLDVWMEERDATHARRLLRVHGERPRCRRTADKRYELAALHVDFVLPFASPATACHPASLILIRVTSIILPSATMRSACADASPARTSSSSSSAVNPFANISASLQPSGEAARSSRARRGSGLGPRRWRWGWGMELAVVVARDLAAL